MKSFIKYICVIDHEDIQHYVEFQEGLNIITGKSSTGKSAMIEIFDYCFGNSENTVPEGVITERAQMYFVVMKVAEAYLVLARRPQEGKAFLNIETDESLVNNISKFSIEYFKDFIPLADFKKELGRSFGIDITDTDTDLEDRKIRPNNRKKESPSARHFTSFMLQHQNLIANKHSLFYRFDEKEKRDQTIEQFKIFSGFFDQDYFIKKQELNELIREQKRLILEKEKSISYGKSMKSRLDILLRDYVAVTGKDLFQESLDLVISKPGGSLAKLLEKRVEVDDNSDRNMLMRSDLVTKRNQVIADRRKQQIVLQNITESIRAIERYVSQSNGIEVMDEVRLKVSACPFCDTPHEMMMKEASDLSSAIDWLNHELSRSSYLFESFKADEKAAKSTIELQSRELSEINRKIKNIDEIIDQLEKDRSLEEQGQKIKLKVESLLEEVKDINDSVIDAQIGEMSNKIDSLSKEIRSRYNSEAKEAEAETIINSRMKTLGAELDFESYYQPINLKFDLKTFDLYHEQSHDKRIYLRSMGSGANWLYSHLALFTSLQYFFCWLGSKCMIPPILFIDQPSQVYFPSIIDTKSSFDAEGLKKQTLVEEETEETIKQKTTKTCYRSLRCSTSWLPTSTIQKKRPGLFHR